MERLEVKYKDACKALETLENIFKEPFSTIIRDAAIQRFEYTFEALWKFLKEYLKEKEGIISNSPKSCFREIFALKEKGDASIYSHGALLIKERFDALFFVIADFISAQIIMPEADPPLAGNLRLQYATIILLTMQHGE